MDDTVPRTLTELARHDAFIRAIARAVLFDPDASQDVVQETVLAALRRDPAKGPASRSWLARVAHHLALNRRREDLRRSVRERIAANPDHVPSAAELADWEESRRRVVVAVNALEEPLRTTVLLRYLRERSEAEVARELGVPLETVRTRLRRARARLRERLGDREGGVDAARLVVLSELGAPSTVTIATGGLLGMGITGWTAGCVVVALLSVAWRLTNDGVEPATGAELAIESRMLASTEEDIAGATETRRIEVVRDGNSVLGRCVDRDRRPLAGIPMGIVGTDRSSVTAVDGHFELALDDITVARLVIVEHRSRDYAAQSQRVRIDPGRDVQLADVVLQPAAFIRGRVTDPAGAPIAGAHVVVVRGVDVPLLPTQGPHGSLLLAETRTAVDGTYEFSSLSPSWVQVFASAEDHLWSHSAVLAARAGWYPESIDLRLDLVTPEFVVRGRLVDAAGAPVAGARIDVDSRVTDRLGNYGGGVLFTDRSLDPDDTFARTGTDGSFAFGVDPRSRSRVSASTDDGRFAVVDGVSPGLGRIELRLERTSLVPVRVFDAGTRAPVMPERVWVTPNSGWPVEIRTSGEAGDVVVHAPNVPWSVSVRAAGYEAGTAFDLPPGGPNGGVVIELVPRSVVRGVIQDSEGRPVPEAVVTLHAFRPLAVSSFHRNGFGTMVGSPASSSRSGADGSFTLELERHVFDGTSRDERQPEFAIRVAATNHATVLRALGPFESVVAASPLDVTLTRGGTIEGRATNHLDTPVQGAVVAASNGDGDVRSTRTRDDGSFRIENMADGPWQVRVMEEDVDPNPPINPIGRRVADVTPDVMVRDGDTSWCEVRTREAPRSTVRGRVLVDGRSTPMFVDLSAYGERPSFLDHRRGSTARGVGGTPARIHEMIGSGLGFEGTTDVDGNYEVHSSRDDFHLLHIGLRPTPYRVAIEVPLDRLEGVVDQSIDVRTGTVRVMSSLTRRRRVDWIGWMPNDVVWLGTDYVDLAGTTLDLRAPEGPVSVYVGDAIHEVDVVAGSVTPLVVGPE